MQVLIDPVMGDICLSVYRNDMVRLERDKQLQVPYQGRRKLTMTIAIEDKPRTPGALEEPGFNVAQEPLEIPWERITGYRVSINEAKLQELKDVGYTATRWGRGQRVDITYQSIMDDMSPENST